MIVGSEYIRPGHHRYLNLWLNGIFYQCQISDLGKCSIYVTAPGSSKHRKGNSMYHPYDSEKYPKRKNPRLQGYDYSAQNYYFVTICTHEKKCIFGEAEKLNDLGEVVRQGIRNMPEHFPNVVVDQYVVMPNHVHILICLERENIELGTIIGTWKAYVTREAHKVRPDLKIWQRNFHDHIIRNERSYQEIWQYIESNPQNWEKDCFYEL